MVANLTVELDPRPAVARVELDDELTVWSADERRAVTAVRRQRREHEPAAARGQHRAAGGERVGARAERRGDDETVAREADEEIAVDVHLGRNLAGAVTHHDEVVDGGQRFRAE